MSKVSTFASQVYSKLSQVPKGRVTTYKYLAQAVGTKAYQAVGQVMKINPYAPEVPCHRVVNSDGKIGGFQGHKSGKSIQSKINLLESEGIVIKEGRVMNFDKRVFTFKSK